MFRTKEGCSYRESIDSSQIFSVWMLYGIYIEFMPAGDCTLSLQPHLSEVRSRKLLRCNSTILEIDELQETKRADVELLNK